MNKEIHPIYSDELAVILEDYSDWLHKHGYIDSDYYTEEPHAIEAYIKEKYNKDIEL